MFRKDSIKVTTRVSGCAYMIYVLPKVYMYLLQFLIVQDYLGQETWGLLAMNCYYLNELLLLNATGNIPYSQKTDLYSHGPVN